MVPPIFEDDIAPANGHNFGSIWTLIKLEVLEKYLRAFNTALKKQRFTRIYIDAFAGTGRCDIKKDGKKTSIDGSARRALATDPPFHRFYFIELNRKKYAALKLLKTEFPGKDIEVIHGNANAKLKALCAKYDWQKERAVLFLDPFGMHVEWATLEAIAKTGAIDVWYLFSYSGLYRQAPKNADAMDSDKEESITRILGTDEWKKQFYAPKRQASLFSEDDDGNERDADHRQMLEFVSERLKTLFPAVIDPKILYQAGDSKAPRGPPQFALYFAASNPKPVAYGLATKIARDVVNAL